MKTPLLIFGTGGHAREILALVQAINANSPTYDLLGWLDDRADSRGETLLDLPLLGNVEDVYARLDLKPEVVIAIGSGAARNRIAARLDKLGIQSAILVHPTAHVGPHVKLGAGTMICAGAILTTGISVGQHGLVNTAALLSHDCVIEEFATIAPRAALAGNVRVEVGADIGIGASILPGLNVGSWSTVGGGSVVTKPVPANSTVVGVPARVIKQRATGWQLQ